MANAAASFVVPLGPISGIDEGAIALAGVEKTQEFFWEQVAVFSVESNKIKPKVVLENPPRRPKTVASNCARRVKA